MVGEYPTSNINAINADLLEVAKLDNVMELQFLDRCISCYSRIRDQNATTTVGGEIINSKRFIYKLWLENILIVGLTMTKDCCCSNNIHKYVFVLFMDHGRLQLCLRRKGVVYHKSPYRENFIMLTAFQVTSRVWRWCSCSRGGWATTCSTPTSPPA